jgi:hypothetical protein
MVKQLLLWKTYERQVKLTGGWIKPYNEKLLYLYSSPNIIRMSNSRMRRGMYVTCNGIEEKCVKWFGGETRREAISWKT